MSVLRVLCILVLGIGLPVLAQGHSYPWLRAAASPTQPFSERFSPPPGFVRTELPKGSFGTWLRDLPLERGRPDVLLFNGKRKANQAAHLAVVRMDVGKRDLQQCADAAIRLRAEYLWSLGKQDDICFGLTSGDAAPWLRWRRGERPEVRGRNVRWSLQTGEDASHDSFRHYLDFVFTYAGTASLERFTVEPVDESRVQPGDLFLQSGFRGHAVLVVDAAEHPDGRRVVALVQSYMPAQQVQVLDNPATPGSPWYAVRPLESMVTPEWTFAPGAARRFREVDLRCLR